MGCRALLPLRGLRSVLQLFRALPERARGTGHRSRHASTRGLGPAPPGGAPRTPASCQSGPRRAEPVPRARSVGDASSSGPRPCSAGIEIWCVADGRTPANGRFVRGCPRAGSSWCFGWRRRTRPGDIGGSTATWPPLECGLPHRVPPLATPTRVGSARAIEALPAHEAASAPPDAGRVARGRGRTLRGELEQARQGAKEEAREAAPQPRRQWWRRA